MTTLQDCCWCLANYKAHLALYRTVLREYLELFYQAVQQELSNQGIITATTDLIRQVEAYVNQQCTYLHFNLEHNALITITTATRDYIQRRQHQAMGMTADQLRATLAAVLGVNGINVPALAQNLQNAANGAARELSLVKISDFYGKDDEDPHEWINEFERAAVANRWVNDA